MTLEQLKERIEATCNKNGIFPKKILVEVLCFTTEISTYIHIERGLSFTRNQPNTDLLIEAVDIECRAIKARQSSATNGIDE